MEAPEKPEPKIIVDEDWKSQVEEEKARLDRQRKSQVADGPSASASPGPATQAPGAATQAGDQVDAGRDEPERTGPLPPATLTTLVTTLATQAIICLGQVPNPVSNKLEVRLDEARHYIDTLQMLEDKTAGSRTPQESSMLSNILHELRMAFVGVGSHSASSHSASSEGSAPTD